MRNFRNNRRRFRNNSFDRNLKINSNDKALNTGLGNVSDFRKKNYPRNNFNSPKLIQKYSDLAREALSSGDKILYENYMQHAEHFIRNSNNYSNTVNIKNGSSQAENDAGMETINDKDIKQENQEKSEDA